MRSRSARGTHGPWTSLALGLVPLLAVALASGCMGSPALGGEEARRWTERQDLEVGERGTFADGALTIIPTEVGDAHAMITVEGSGGTSRGRLTTDPGGFITVATYRIYLLSAETGRRAVIAVGPAG